MARVRCTSADLGHLHRRRRRNWGKGFFGQGLMEKQGYYPYLCHATPLGFAFSRHVMAELPCARRCRFSSRRGLSLEKRQNRAFLPGLFWMCFKTSAVQEHGDGQVSKWPAFCAPDASQRAPRLPNEFLVLAEDTAYSLVFIYHAFWH